MAAETVIAGATGYIGRALAEALSARGEPPRALARNPDGAGALRALGCEVVEGDVLRAKTLAPALDGSRVAYYLVHSMGRGGEGNFAARDREGATNFGRAAKAAGIEQIIYLGGLAEGGSPHLESRHRTAQYLGAAGVPLTYFRAAAVIGAGSESFRTLYWLVRRLPVMVTPRWTATRTQPIWIEDAIAYLADSPAVEGARGRSIEIGGPDVTTYGGMFDRLADAMGRRRPLKLSVPLLTPWLSSLWIGLVTPVDAGVARPLVEGLATETVVRDRAGMTLFDVEPVGLDEAMRAAVAEAAHAL